MFSHVHNAYKSRFDKTYKTSLHHAFPQGDHGEHGEHGTEHTEHTEHSEHAEHTEHSSGRSPWMLYGETRVEGDSWHCSALNHFDPL